MNHKVKRIEYAVEYEDDIDIPSIIYRRVLIELKVKTSCLII
ncbi:hypothetical protein D1BOALGB6SA_5858 [Olavius sp. associated proteobacterium Delta 1]|nr:hypothetical protein D1BOALGB6SA_5858 [Olavius sp. associated proteobacterium Delta 1]